MSELLRAREGFHIPSERVTIKGGQVMPVGHPFIKGREHRFEPAETGVEQATKSPGEIRIGMPRRDAVIASVPKAAKPAKGRKAHPTPQAPVAVPASEDGE